MTTSLTCCKCRSDCSGRVSEAQGLCERGTGLHRNRSALCGDCRIYPLIHFIESSPLEKISIDSAAEVMQLSTSRFRHLFKLLVGLSFHQYLIDLRLNQARHLLQTTDQPIHEIAAKLGINDLSHFRRDFKRNFGCSPGAYRAQKRRQMMETNLKPAEQMEK